MVRIYISEDKCVLYFICDTFLSCTYVFIHYFTVKDQGRLYISGVMHHSITINTMKWSGGIYFINVGAITFVRGRQRLEMCDY